jgi:hypothetical protein
VAAVFAPGGRVNVAGADLASTSIFEIVSEISPTISKCIQ